MRLFQSFVGKTIAIVCAIMIVCSALLMVASYSVIRNGQVTQFTQTAETLSMYLGEQVSAGTRLKRGAMVEPQVMSALENEGLTLDGIRVTHVDGTEVLSATAPDADESWATAIPRAEFTAAVKSASINGHVYARVPIVLGVGENKEIVGELAAFWNTDRKNAEVFRQSAIFSAALLLTLVVLCGAIITALRIFVSKPLNKTIEAMTEISDEKEDVQLPPRSSSEISKVVDALDKFQASLIERRRSAKSLIIR